MCGSLWRDAGAHVGVIIQGEFEHTDHSAVSCREKFNRVQLRQVRRDMEHDNHRSITTDPGHAERSAGRAHACT